MKSGRAIKSISFLFLIGLLMAGLLASGTGCSAKDLARGKTGLGEAEKRDAGTGSAGGSGSTPGTGSGTGGDPNGKAGKAGAGTREDSQGEVVVAVSWDGTGAGLTFQVALDTHSQSLGQYDLKELAVLKLDEGRELQPASWEPSGDDHHLSGMLTFPERGPGGEENLGSQVRGITLKIRDVSEVPERVFRWNW
ncbi:MAG: hypothetical protein HYY09_02085 [Firmicutes bacterium]|nr:hypothetical protein [Bacillota bacterium]